jgi:hypothetical protein
MFENIPILKTTGKNTENCGLISIHNFRCKNAIHKRQMQNTDVDGKSIGLDIDVLNLNTM